MTQEIERLGCPFCGAQPQEYSGDSDFLECSNEDCDLHGVEIQEDYWQARARVGKGEVEAEQYWPIDVAGDGKSVSAAVQWFCDLQKQHHLYGFRPLHVMRILKHVASVLERPDAAQANPVEVGELARQCATPIRLANGEYDECGLETLGIHRHELQAKRCAQAILNKYNVTEKL